MATVFLSYAREDTARVRPLAACLEKSGYTVWWDERIKGGSQFALAIEKALEAADAVVVVWTEASCRSAWVRDEAAVGRDSGRLVPVCLDGCLPPLGFRQYQVVDLTGWTGRSDARQLAPLIQAIDGIVGRQREDEDSATTRVPISSGKYWTAKPRLTIATAALALLLVSGGLLYPRISAWTDAGSVQPRVSLGEFAMLSPDLPPDMSQAINAEVLAAFGAENAVAVTTAAGSKKTRSAPFLLDGSIRKNGDALRFTVNLKDTDNGVVIWSRAYDRSAADSLAPRQVSVASSQVVRCGLWGASTYPRRMSYEALSLYLKFCSELWGGSPVEEQILDAARRVTVAVPDFSFGWSALALAAVPLSQGASSADASKLREEAMEAARKSIKLDPFNPEGYMAMAGLIPLNRFAEREEMLKKAISVRPTECGCERMSYGDFLTSVGRMDEAVKQYERARAMMPLAPFTNVRLVQALYVIGRHEDADRILTQMLEIWPDATSLRLLKLKSAFWTRRYEQAIPMLEEAGLHLTAAQRDALAATFAALASNDPAQRAQAAVIMQSVVADPRRNDRMLVAALAALGSDVAALSAATLLIEARGYMLADVLFEPNLAAASSNHGYAKLVNELGLAAYWRKTKQIPDICRGTRKPGFCIIA